MAEDDLPPSDEPRTVFIPSSSPRRPAKAGAGGVDDGGTGFEPTTPPGAGFADDGGASGGKRAGTSAPRARRQRPSGQIAIGAVLNGSYRVKRLHGRGGMAEVYEGVNVADETDRVAIKVMLPALTMDPNVQNLFLAEARTLMKISHPALVQYRGLSQDKKLGLTYLVTEFIDGPSLAEKLGSLPQTSTELAALTRRLAEGLRAAHEHGVIHRDLSPDNILLADARLSKAKIIDFGIAKNIDAGKSMIGDGFAGKLGYVAPEQFGQFDRQIGPWTDVYSLALVILSVALGKNVDMGATLYEAVARRETGPDLSPLPADLRPVIERMVAADPAHRSRSMDEVIDALDGRSKVTTPPIAAPVTPMPVPMAVPEPAPVDEAKQKDAGPKPVRRQGPPLITPRRAMMAGGAAAAVVVVIVGVTLVLVRPPAPPPPNTTTHPALVQAAAQPAQSSPPAPAHMRDIVQQTLPGVPCSWLSLKSDQGLGDAGPFTLTGFAGNNSTVSSSFEAAIRTKGGAVSDVTYQTVAIGNAQCALLDALRPFKADDAGSAPHLSSPPKAYGFTSTEPGSGKPAARPVIELDISDQSRDIAVFGVSPSGDLDPIISSRKDLSGKLAQAEKAGVLIDNGGGRYSIKPFQTDTGWSGILLLRGAGMLDSTALAAPVALRGADWNSRVAAALRNGDWKAEMVWFQVAP